MQWPLTVAALVFLVAYAWPIIDPTIPGWLDQVCTVVVWLTWGMFVLDYLARLALAEKRLSFVRGNLFDLLVIALPLLRPLRLLRLVTLLQGVNRRASTQLRGKLVSYVAGGSALLSFCAALAVLDAERDAPDANITDFGDAMWWAITTMTTVGYGDRFPVTPTGRFAAAGLMLAGIALLGVVTATLASWLVERVSEEEAERSGDLHAELTALREQIAELTNSLGTTADREEPDP